MLVLILHQAVSTNSSPDDRDVLDQVAAVSSALDRLQIDATACPVTLDLLKLRRTIDDVRPNIVFNLVESLGGSDRLVPLTPWALDAWQIPYTGVSAAAIARTSDKISAKHELGRNGLPTPWCFHFSEKRRPSPAGSSDVLSDDRDANKFLIKAVHEHASLGMNAASIVDVESVAALEFACAAWRRNTGVECFAEQFIDGREFNLSLLDSDDGPQVLPPAEIDFSSFPPELPRIVDYRAKWDETSFEYQNTPRTFAFPDSDRPLLEKMTALARRCWDVFDLRGYARVDFRVDRRGEPWILEINANPCLSPDAGFAAALDRAGVSFDQAIARILAASL